MFKKLITIMAILTLVACTAGPTVGGEMAGRPTRVDLSGYEEMCAREPTSELCTPEG